MGGDGCRGQSDVFGGGGVWRGACGEVGGGGVERCVWGGGGGGLGPVVSLTQERAAPGEGPATHRSSALCKMPATHPRMHRSLDLPLSLFFRLGSLLSALRGNPAVLPRPLGCPAPPMAIPPNRRRDDSASLRPSCPTAKKKKNRFYRVPDWFIKPLPPPPLPEGSLPPPIK